MRHGETMRYVPSTAASVTAAPVTTPVRRLDQTLAARQPNLRWTPPTTRRQSTK